MIVTVTMNAAIDRTLTVPNFQRGQRHRASAGLTLAGGKGINIARALKRLGVPVVATGLAGGRTGTRIVEELTAEAILNDFVRIDDESRTSTAIVDPTGGSYTEVNEWGPHVSAEELEMLFEKLVYLSQGADYVVFSGSLPRGIDDGFYAEAVRELNRRGARTVLDSEGEAAAPRRAGRAAARLAERARGRGARRPGVQRRRRLPHRPRDDRRARRAQRPDHARVGLLGAAAKRAPGQRATAPPRRWSIRSRRSARATSCWPRSSRRGSTAARTRRRCAPRSPRAPPRRSRSARAGSSRERPAG